MSKMSKWGEDKTVKFVELYRDYECLWNVKAELYKSKTARNLALAKVVEEMNIPNFGVHEAKQKIKNLRSTYMQELNKIEKSRLSANAPDEIHKSALKWFPIMDTFIRTVQLKRKNTNHLDNPLENPYGHDVGNPEIGMQWDFIENSPVQESPTENEPPEDPFEYPEVAHTPQIKYVPKVKKSRILEVNSAVKELKELVAELNQPPRVNQDLPESPKEENECDIFGKHVSAQLKKLSVEELIVAQEEIQKILTHCRLRDNQRRIDMYNNT